MIKKLIGSLYALIVVCIGVATIIEKYQGTSFVSEHVYGSWWFVVMWAVLTVAACIYMCQQRLYRRLAVMMLHASFVVILVGALTTLLTARRGTVNLRLHQPTAEYCDAHGMMHQLPFTLQLKEFRIVNYPGTDVPLDYQSVIQSRGDAEAGNEFVVSMNNVGNVSGYRLFQSGYDSDGQGVSLGVCFDPYGIAVTYAGYLFLLIGIVATLFSRKTHIRALYRSIAQPAMIVVVLLLAPMTAQATELQAVDREVASRFGTINVLYNNRICPINTVAIDFVTKLSGKATWNGYKIGRAHV